MLRRLSRTLFSRLWPGTAARRRRGGYSRARGAVTHVIILDGTMSTLNDGDETNAGLTYRLLAERGGTDLSLYYEAGLQWRTWRNSWDVIVGKGINRQIRRAYGYLASRYRPGDRIFLFGYSRGAYAVRSLAGVIDSVGLLKASNATERNVELAYRHYRYGTNAAAAFRKANCHPDAVVEMIGVWDTVKALGVRLPLVWKLTEKSHKFHHHQLSRCVKAGFHALALQENRAAYEPVMWVSDPSWSGRLEQVWFAGTHGDVGGQLGGDTASRPLSNIPLVWMLSQAELCGLALPQGWRARFPTDPNAPSIGTWRGLGKIFLYRSRRVVGADPSERLHETAIARGLHMSYPAGHTA
ncbi:DUF2235 domain-containing protein [Pseudooceanicola sp. 216_PA32_1]|uniref:DUF2235 domain-containing protein n=2 Tax=Pseudooceanicola pacificus TaxID=2676438 RepID=A0A844W9Q8_9RHOB|nr:DUF2235 domain-containing protein [Pseudooceanicola pacificus]MWB77613.1 DUF2235 domain-containing protein [Pseudooceanicola pacificus]